VTSTEVTALDVTTATAPTPDEAAKVLQGMVGHFMTFTNDQGHLAEQPRPELPGDGRHRQPVGPVRHGHQPAVPDERGEQPDHGLKSMGYNFDVVLNPNLTTATDKVYLFRTDAKLNPFILQEETAPKVTVIGAGSEEEFKNRRHLFGTERIANAGYGLWQYAMKGTLS
jgi:hypothetical protein